MDDLSALQLDKKTETILSAGILSAAEISEVYDRHINTVYRVCYSFMGNHPDAQDASQSVFLKLMKTRVGFSGSEHEKAWLITAAKNQCRDLHRQWWRRHVVTSDQAVEAEVEDTYRENSLPELLQQLPSKLRIVLYLHYYEGYKLAEISCLLKLNLNTVKTRLRTAKKRLKLELGADKYDEK